MYEFIANIEIFIAAFIVSYLLNCYNCAAKPNIEDGIIFVGSLSALMIFLYEIGWIGILL